MKKMITNLSGSVYIAAPYKQCILGMTLNFDILVSLICNNINVWS